MTLFFSDTYRDLTVVIPPLGGTMVRFAGGRLDTDGFPEEQRAAIEETLRNLNLVYEDDGTFPCPWSDCAYRNATEKGLAAHMRAKHGGVTPGSNTVRGVRTPVATAPIARLDGEEETT